MIFHTVSLENTWSLWLALEDSMYMGWGGCVCVCVGGGTYFHLSVHIHNVFSTWMVRIGSHNRLGG